MSDDVVYFNQMLWNYCDKLVSSSNLNVDKFSAKDKWGISPPKLKFSINHYKSKTSIQITLSHQEVFNLLQQFKKYENQIGTICKEITEDQNKQYTFSIKNKKNLFVTFLSRTEYNGPCIRIVISERDNDYLDSEKIYLPIYDFLSLVIVLAQFKNQYLSAVDSMSLLIVVSDLNDKILSLDNKLTSYYSEFTSKNKPVDEIQYHNGKIYGDHDSEPVKQEEKHSSSTDKSESVNSEVIHDDMSNFIQKNIDTYDLGIGSTIVDKPKPNLDSVNALPTTFTEKMLLNNLSNLEMYIMNLINDDLPFSKFSELIKSKLGFDALEGISIEDVNSVDYLTSLFLKSNIRDNLDKKQEIPNSVPPIVFNNVNSNENKISLAYDLYLYCIYYSYLRNILKDKDYSVLANKELITFALKTISSPYVFSLVKTIDIHVLIAELLNRFRKYHTVGVFDEVEKFILETRSITVSLSEDTIKTEANRIYSVIIQRWDNLTPEGTFKERKNILKYDDFKKNILSKEQIKKILAAEFSFKKNNRVDFKEAGINSFDDIPLSISEKYGVIKQKFDNTNLKRFIKDKCKDNEELCKKCIEIADLINESYRDLKNKNVDYSVIPEEVLKAIILWDLKSDNKLASNYLHLLEQVQKSTLERSMIISMLLNISESTDSSFTNSFIASRDD